MSKGSEKSPLVNRGVGATKANVDDRPFTPAEFASESYQYSQIKGSQLPSKDCDVSLIVCARVCV